MLYVIFYNIFSSDIFKNSLKFNYNFSNFTAYVNTTFRVDPNSNQLCNLVEKQNACFVINYSRIESLGMSTRNINCQYKMNSNYITFGTLK